MKKLFLGVALLAAVLAAGAQTADDVVNKHITAIGGSDNLAKIENVVMEGNLNIGGGEVVLKITRVKDKLARQDISLMGMNGYDLTTDKDGWTFLPFAGQAAPTQKTAEEVKAAQEDLDVSDPICNAKTKGRLIELQGKEDVNGTECFKLKVTSSSGEAMTCYVDPASFYLVRIVQSKTVMGQSMTVPVDFSDYKDVDGVKFPYTIGTPQGAMTFSSIKANQTIDAKAYLHE